MSSSSTTVNNLKINRGTYSVLQANLSSIGENELVLVTDKAVPIPQTSDSGKVITVTASGEYALQLPSSGMTNPMTTAGDIIYGGTSGTPTRLAKGTAGQVLTMNSNGTAPTWAAASSGISEISTQYIRITDLNPGVYKLTYNGTKYLYYMGTSSTTTHTVAGGAGTVILNVSKYSTTYWQWYYINSNSTATLPTIYYGYSYSSSGSTGSKALNSLLTTDNNYYPIRSYTSGLQISSYSGSTNCQLYVPYCTYSQYGVVKPAYNTTGTATLTTTAGSYSNSPTINARTTTEGKYYAVEKDSNGRLFVNVPWTGGGTATGIAYSTTAPSSDNLDGDLKVVVLTSNPATKYNGYWYIITGA